MRATSPLATGPTALCEAKDQLPNALRPSRLLDVDDNGEPGYCAVGWLLHAAGCSDEHLYRQRFPATKDYVLLRNHYGLAIDDVDTIMHTNDSCADDRTRGIVIRKLLTDICEERRGA